MMKLVQQASFSLPQRDENKGGPKSKMRSHKCATTSLYQQVPSRVGFPMSFFRNAGPNIGKRD